MNKWFVIINPASGNKFVKKRKANVLNSLKKLNSLYEIAFTKYSKHEEELVDFAIKKGFRKIISVGGDGTLNHVVNGALIQREVPVSEIKIGVIPIGTGNDWIKNNNIPNNIEKAIEILNSGKTSKLDIGKIIHNGNVSYFNILVGIGYDGFVVDKAIRLKKYGNSAYFLASLFGIFNYKKSVLKFTFNGKSLEYKSLMSIIGIGKFCGGGMQFTHKVDARDGLFDITLVKDFKLHTLLYNAKMMYNGKLTLHKDVETHKTNKIKIEVKEGQNPFIEADGEIIGKGDFEVEILPLAVPFIVG